MVIVVVVVVIYGRPAVYSVVNCGGCCLRCICGASAVRLRIVVVVEVVVEVVVCVGVCGTPTVPLRCARYPCGMRAVPLRCARGTLAVRPRYPCCAIVVWLSAARCLRCICGKLAVCGILAVCGRLVDWLSVVDCCGGIVGCGSCWPRR